MIMLHAQPAAESRTGQSTCIDFLLVLQLFNLIDFFPYTVVRLKELKSLSKRDDEDEDE